GVAMLRASSRATGLPTGSAADELQEPRGRRSTIVGAAVCASVPHGHPPQNRRQVAGCRVDLAEDGGTLKFLSRRLALLLVALVGLSLAATRGTAAAACQSSCAQQLAACKPTCPGGGQGRRACPAACTSPAT